MYAAEFLLLLPFIVLYVGFQFKQKIKQKSNKTFLIWKYVLSAVILGPFLLFLITARPWAENVEEKVIIAVYTAAFLVPILWCVFEGLRELRNSNKEIK